MSDTVADRLEQLGLLLPEVPAPVAAYVPAIRAGSLVFSSGQLPIAGGQLMAVGKVGNDAHSIDPDRASALARICALNAIAAIRSVIDDLDLVTQVVKVVGFVASDPSFTGQPAVINGASELLGAVFAERGRHARSAVGVSVLPLDAPVEVEVVVAVD